MAHKIRFHGTIMHISRALGGGAAWSVAILGIALAGCALALLPINTATAAAAEEAMVRGTNSQRSETTDQPLLLAKAKKEDDDLLDKDDDDDDDDLLKADDDDDDEETSQKESADEKVTQDADADHKALFLESRFPAAATCATCHPKHYKEWSVSQHSYAQLSPVYLSLSNKINILSNGSNGDFCLRCHNQVGANLGENPYDSNLTRHPTSREGITCVVCHRINKNYNKASGRLALVEGDLTTDIFGPGGNKELERVLANTKDYKVVTDPNEPGRKIHKEVKKYGAFSDPMFCGACHDVTLFNGFRLEEAFSEYRTSPAAARGTTCQDCHMGKIQGKASGYEFGPAAVVGDVPTKDRKLTNHFFAGPDYSVISPGIFPHNTTAQQMASIAEWLKFDIAAGWGTDQFEDNVSDDYKFPERWQFIDDRYDAREIIVEQIERLEWARLKRLEVLRNGYVLGNIKTLRADAGGIAFKVQVKNGTDGHNVPTGFTGERLVWLEVTVKDADGKVVFISGDRDPNGDLRDGHSSYVHAGKVELDKHLLSLQSLFVTQNGRGGEIEHVIPIPYPFTSLPRVLPSPVSLVFTGEPSTERVHKMGIEPNGERWGHYEVPADALTTNGTYTATIKLISQPAPVNLLLAIQDVGFDYGITPAQARDALVQGAQVLWEEELKFEGINR